MCYLGMMDFAPRPCFKCQKTRPMDRLVSSQSICRSRKKFPQLVVEISREILIGSPHTNAETLRRMIGYWGTYPAEVDLSWLWLDRKGIKCGEDVKDHPQRIIQIRLIISTSASSWQGFACHSQSDHDVGPSQSDGPFREIFGRPAQRALFGAD